MTKYDQVLRLVESALLLAMATVLSMFPLASLPYGGSITACSALPILLIAYRHGTAWGLFSAAAYALLQLLLGMNNLSYFTTAISVVVVILLDYIVPFVCMGLGGVFRKGRPQGQALVMGAVLCGVLRYICHVISGCTVWAGLSIPDQAALLYSLAYNATYMVPETLVTVLGAWYLSRVLDVRGDRPTRAATPAGQRPVASLVAAGVLTAAGIADVVLVFLHLQNGDTGEFDITGIAQANWALIGGITLAAVATAVVLTLVGRSRKKAA